MRPSSTSTCRHELPARSGQVILLLDDDREFRSAVAEILRDDGHEVLDYADPAEVPPLQSLGRVTALVTDYRMPGTDGVTFADRFHAAHPGAPVIVTTSYTTAFLESAVAARPYIHLLRKPMDYTTLIALVEPGYEFGCRDNPTVEEAHAPVPAPL
jgi:two-component system nitrogen regulation response regulator GlnG